MAIRALASKLRIPAAAPRWTPPLSRPASTAPKGKLVGTTTRPNLSAAEESSPPPPKPAAHNTTAEKSSLDFHEMLLLERIRTHENRYFWKMVFSQTIGGLIGFGLVLYAVKDISKLDD